MEASAGKTRLGFGLMRLPLKTAGNPASVDLDKTIELVDFYLSKGFSHFDTSIIYHAGRSETILRKAVAERYPRESFTVTDKMPMVVIKSEALLAPTFHTELRRCGIGYFDYYWLHSIDKATYKTAERVRAFEFIARKKAEGKIKHIGFSYHDDAALLDEILTKHPETEFVQLQINYLDWDDANIQSRACWETARKHGKQIMVMEPVKGGLLANLPPEAEKLLRDADPSASAASWAIRFAASLEGVVSVLSGMSNKEQIEDNARALGGFTPLTDGEKQMLAEAAKLVRGSVKVPCTSCRYCVDACPKNIPIPEYFALYNNKTRFGKKQNMTNFTYYRNASRGRGKPSDCIKCRQCEKHCPQHLKISELMEEAAKTL